MMLKALIFDLDLWHSGSEIISGTKPLIGFNIFNNII